MTPSDVYRVPGRTPHRARPAPPPWRMLVAPLGRAAACAAVAWAVLIVVGALAPPLFGTSDDVRFIPAVDVVGNCLTMAPVASLLVLAFALVRRVRPSWGGMGTWSKIGYVTALLVVHCTIIAATEVLVVASQGGLHLFGPSHVFSVRSANGRFVHVYTRGLACGYEVFVSEPLALTQRRLMTIPRSSCSEPPPRVRATADGTFDLVRRRQTTRAAARAALLDRTRLLNPVRARRRSMSSAAVIGGDGPPLTAPERTRSRGSRAHGSALMPDAETGACIRSSTTYPRPGIA